MWRRVQLWGRKQTGRYRLVSSGKLPFRCTGPFSEAPAHMNGDQCVNWVLA